MKKICIYVTYLFTVGGIQKVVTTLANELCKEYDVTIVYKYNKRHKENDFIDNRVKLVNITDDSLFEKIISFPFKVVRKILKRFEFNKKYSFYYDLFCERLGLIERKKIVNFVNKNQFDFLLAEGIDCCISFSKIKKHIKAKTIGCWHSSYDRYATLYPKKSLIKSIKKLDDTVVLSQLDVKKIKTNYGLSVKSIYNPIKLVKKVNHKLKQNKFVAVGRYSKIKQFDKLIEAFKIFNEKNKEWKLEIVGEGSERKNLQNLIDKYNLNSFVTLTGATNCVNAYYESSKILMITSKDEGFCMAAIEAMQYGLAIIAYDVPVLHEVIKKDNGFIENGNIEKLAEQMLKYVANDNIIKNEGKQNIKTVQMYNVEEIIKQWKKVLR